MNKSRPLKSIRLQLARSKQHPEGSQNHGYQFVAPLDAEGHIDPEAWKAHRDQCRVRRFWQGEEDQTGRLVHKPGGAEHAGGCSTTIRSGMMTTSLAIASAPISLHPANMSLSPMNAENCTRFE